MNIAQKKTVPEAIRPAPYNKEIDQIVSNIIQTRLHKHLSQRQMAAKMGITQNAYCKLETKQTRLTINYLLQIAEIFKMSVKDILSGSVCVLCLSVFYLV